MAKISKNEKRDLIKKWKDKQKREYILNRTEVKKLFGFLERKLEQTPCNHTMHYTEEWICNNFEDDKRNDIIGEFNEMGGYCDCEVLMNCYEIYDI